MAVPVTIASLTQSWITKQVVRPFKATNGNFYCAIWHQDGNAERITIYKATDPTSSWSVVTNTDLNLVTITMFSSYMDGNDLHCFATRGSAASTYYGVFNVSSETWTTTFAVTGWSAGGGSVPTTHEFTILSNGDLLVAYDGLSDAVKGDEKCRTDYAVYTTSWSSGNAYDDADISSDVHYHAPRAAAGSSGSFQLGFCVQTSTADDPPGVMEEARFTRYVSSLSTSVTDPSSYQMPLQPLGHPTITDVTVNSNPGWVTLNYHSGNDRLKVTEWYQSSNTPARQASYNDDTNGGYSWTGPSSSAFFSAGMARESSSVVWLVWSDNDQDIRVNSLTIGTGLGTATELRNGITTTQVYCNVYTRGAATVLGIIYANTASGTPPVSETWTYDEYVIDAGAQTISVGTGIASGEVVPSQTIALSTRQSISAAGGIVTGESLASDHTIALSTRQSISAAGGIATGESLATDHQLSIVATTQTISSAGAIASGESLATDHTIANVFQSITSAGAIPSGESFATDHDVNLRLRIEAAGAIASGESLATDHSLTQPFQTITSAGAIASGESLATDHSLTQPFQTISSAGAIASGESLATDHSLTQPFQTISSAGAISTGESLATDHDINLRLRIEAAGAISTGESLATDHQLIIITNDVQNAGDIASGESFATDHAITNVFQSITDAGAIASGESFATDHSLTQPFQTISSAGGVVSGESFATDHDINLRLRIEAAGAIASGESLATDHTIANVFQSITDAGGITSGESLATDHTIANVFQSITDAGAIPSGESLATDHDINLRLRIEAAGGISTAESLATDHSLTQPFQTISSAGAISTGESLATDHQLIIVTNDVLNAGDIASGESFATDHAITNVFQSISDAGAIASGEAFQTDHDINLRLRIEAAGGIASGESLAVDHTVALSTPQSISAAGGIVSGESLASDHTVALSTRLSISAAGGIISGEVIPSQTIANVVQEIIASGIASAESFATDHNIVLSSTTQTITNAGSILSGESFATDHSIQSFAQFITVADGILSAEAFEVDNQVTELLLIITQAGAIPSAEQVPGSLTIGDAVLDNPTPDGLYVHGTGLGLSGQIYAVQVAKTFGGAPTDVFLAGTRHTVSGAMYITFDSPDASAVWINGILHTPTGIRYCVDAIGSDKWPEGFATDAGSLTITTSIGGFYLRAIRRTIDGRMVIDL